MVWFRMVRFQERERLERGVVVDGGSRISNKILARKKDMMELLDRKGK